MLCLPDVLCYMGMSYNQGDAGCGCVSVILHSSSDVIIHVRECFIRKECAEFLWCVSFADYTNYSKTSAVMVR